MNLYDINKYMNALKMSEYFKEQMNNISHSQCQT